MNTHSATNPSQTSFEFLFEKPPQSDSLNLRALTPFQRCLLLGDGTLTRFIEAYTLEPVEVTLLGQEKKILSSRHRYLEADAGTEVLFREVLLRGKHSETLYVYAVSLLVLDRLQEDIRKNLEAGRRGVGQMMKDARIETFREILWQGKGSLGNTPEALRYLAGREFLHRTYRIFSEKCPAALIREYFLFGPELSPAQD